MCFCNICRLPNIILLEALTYTKTPSSSAAGSESTYSSGFSRGADGLGHLAQNLVTVAGRVSSCLDLLFSHFLAVDVESDAGG